MNRPGRAHDRDDMADKNPPLKILLSRLLRMNRIIIIEVRLLLVTLFVYHTMLSLKIVTIFLHEGYISIRHHTKPASRLAILLELDVIVSLLNVLDLGDENINNGRIRESTGVA